MSDNERNPAGEEAPPGQNPNRDSSLKRRDIVPPSAGPVDPFAAAVEQARARWGDRGIVHEAITVDAEGHREVIFVVGRRHDPWAWSAIGWGASWGEAFALADRTEGRVRR